MIYKPSKFIYSSVHIDRVYHFIRDHFSRIPLFTYISFKGPHSSTRLSQAHKLVLSACSPVFRSIFNNSTQNHPIGSFFLVSFLLIEKLRHKIFFFQIINFGSIDQFFPVHSLLALFLFGLVSLARFKKSYCSLYAWHIFPQPGGRSQVYVQRGGLCIPGEAQVGF